MVVLNGLVLTAEILVLMVAVVLMVLVFVVKGPWWRIMVENGGGFGIYIYRYVVCMFVALRHNNSIYVISWS